VRFLQNPDLADESISANLASIHTSDHNNITNKTDIRQKNAGAANQHDVHRVTGISTIVILQSKMCYKWN
jgi:hypothetical protein